MPFHAIIGDMHNNNNVPSAQNFHIFSPEEGRKSLVLILSFGGAMLVYLSKKVGHPEEQIEI